jgi:hypothetical protein
MKVGLVKAVIAVGTVTVLTGCGANTDASQESGPPSPTQAASPIPPVKNPRDVIPMARRPCELLTSQQAKRFGLDLPPEQMDGLLGTLRCEWTTTTHEQETIRTVDVSMFTNNPTLEVVYSKDRGLPFFELTDISGYPAIITRTNADLAICSIDIKVAERQSVSVDYNSKEFDKNPQQACEINKQVAAAVLMNLPAKS